MVLPPFTFIYQLCTTKHTWKAPEWWLLNSHARRRYTAPPLWAAPRIIYQDSMVWQTWMTWICNYRWMPESQHKSYKLVIPGEKSRFSPVADRFLWVSNHLFCWTFPSTFKLHLTRRSRCGDGITHLSKGDTNRIWHRILLSMLWKFQS